MNSVVQITFILLTATFCQDGDSNTIVDFDRHFLKAVARAQSSVVSLRVERREESVEAASKRRKLFSENSIFATRPPNAPATATIIDPNGYLLTTYFNVEGSLLKITAIFPDNTEAEAQLVGFDGNNDLALLKIRRAGLPVLAACDPGEISIGQSVAALGRGPDETSLTINPGIVSALGRMAGRCIQTDAKLNYGNVGGPLIDGQGRLVGITCRVSTRNAAHYGQNSGVGFAITWDELNQLLPNLKEGVKIAPNRRPFLGIQARPDSEADGCEIGDVIPGSAAQRAGLRTGDIVIEFAGKAIHSFDELRNAISKHAVGEKIVLSYLRDDEDHETTVELGESIDP